MQENLHPKISGLSFIWEKSQVKVEAYLIKGRVNAVVDTGPPQAPTVMASVLAPAGVKTGDIGFILHTHGHLDHAGGDRIVKAAAPGARLCAHSGDALFFNDPGAWFERFTAPFVKAQGRREHLAEEKAAFLEEHKVTGRADRLLEENETIDLGDGVELKVVHLPGHTPGSVGFYWEKEGALFSGDCVSGLHSPGGSLPIIYDFAAYERSIERLLGMPLRFLLCSHHYRGLRLPPSPVRAGGEIKEFLNDSLRASKSIREAAARQAALGPGRSPIEIADAVIAELPAEMGFLPLASLRSSLFSVRTVFWCLSGTGGPQ